MRDEIDVAQLKPAASSSPNHALEAARSHGRAAIVTDPRFQSRFVGSILSFGFAPYTRVGALVLTSDGQWREGIRRGFARAPARDNTAEFDVPALFKEHG